MKKKALAVMAIVGMFASNAMAQAVDPATEASTAVTTLGTVFGSIFALAVGITIAWKVIKYLRPA